LQAVHFFAAEFSGGYYAIAIWTDPIAANRMRNAENTIELRRMAISADAPKNTASRMLAVMARLLKRKFPELNRLISYQAVEVHAGTIYKAAGWIPGNAIDFVPWKSRPGEATRRPPQIESGKVRWEKNV
jgi:hypothetical protein